jgi:dsDNA-specific endonuclease/ATPase MutS2
MPFENLNDGPAFNFVFSLQKPDKKKAEMFETTLKLKPRQVFNRIQEIRQKSEATFSYKLLETYPDREIEDKMEMAPLLKKGYKVYSASTARQHLEPSKYELDLHIEKLSRDHATLSSFEKLTLQLQTLEKYLDLAVAHHQPSMIVIHGMGTGKLRDEIHEILRTRRDVKSFINRYHPAYGYGATEIFFQW